MSGRDGVVSGWGHAGQQLLRFGLLAAVVGVSGVLLGLALGYPASRIEFEESTAVQLDQSRLAGTLDPADAIVVDTDLPVSWEPGDPAAAAFSLLGAPFCGEDVALPTVLSERQSAVYTNPTDDSLLISEAVRVDRWQSAREYIDSVADAVSSCERFFRPGPDGERVRVDIREGPGDAPITDHVSRTFVAEDGESVQVFSMMAVGDLVIMLLHAGPTRPPEGLMSGLEDDILVRVDPRDFAPGGVPVEPDGGDGVDGDGSTTTVIEGGAADETETPVDPVVPEGDIVPPDAGGEDLPGGVEEPTG